MVYVNTRSIIIILYSRYTVQCTLYTLHLLTYRQIDIFIFQVSIL